MKKIIAMLLALTLAFGLVACANNGGDNTTTGTTAEITEGTTEGTTGEETVGELVATTKALEIMTTIWNALPEEKKFPVMGGDANHMVDGAPGLHSLADEGILYTMLVPETEVANIDEAATMINAMMINNFCGGVYHVTGDAKAFAEAMHGAISTNRWMCGMPEKMVIAIIDGEYVLAMYGLNDFVNALETEMGKAYTNVQTLYSEAITE